MTINQIKYFISVAKHLNFTKAAKEHYIAQTAISQQIINLEKELNTVLFHRNKRTVQLTKAGAIFYEEAQHIVSILENAILTTQQTTQINSSNYQGALTIGFQHPHQTGLAASLVRNFCSTYPNVTLKLMPDFRDNLPKALQEGDLDLVFYAVETTNEIGDFSWKLIAHLFKNYLCAVVPTKHPLAKKNSVTRAALAHERFVHFDRHSSPMSYYRMLRDCEKCGFLPNIVAEATDPETLLFLVESGTGIAVIPRCFETNSNKDAVQFINLIGENETTDLVVMWRQNNYNPAISLFLSLIQNEKQECQLST
ncbi:MAG: transcriptional regulator AlsR family [Firmicutes bacterium]|nr:transcriptional regulator AlsR family [Bacillota bacterium]